MSNITPVSSFDAVPRLETATPALAGPSGAMTAQAQALANRSEYLKTQTDAHTAVIGNTGIAADARNRLGLGDVVVGYNARGNWATATAYVVNDVVAQSSIAYQCIVAHTSGTFATDLAAAKWAVYQGLRAADLAASGGAGMVGYGGATVADRLDDFALIQAADIDASQHLGINNYPVADSHVLAITKSSQQGANVVSAWQIQNRIDSVFPPWSGVKSALRIVNTIGTDADDPMTIGTAWTINAAADLKSNVSTAESFTALSGALFKRGRYQHAIAGHLMVREYYDFSAAGHDPTPVVACEMNASAVGPDSATANDGFGSRMLLTMWARTNMEVAGASGNRAEVGCAISIQPKSVDDATDGAADFRYGILVRDRWQFGSARRVKEAGLRIDTAGNYGIYIKSKSTVANILLAAGDATYGDPAYGLVCLANYTSGTAIRIPADQCIGFDSTNSVRARYNSTNQRLEFLSGGVVRGHIDMTGADHAL